MKFPIKRSDWHRGIKPIAGVPSSLSRLQNEITNKKCCLGFFSLACGFREDQIFAINCPESLISFLEQTSDSGAVLIPEDYIDLLTLGQANSGICNKLMNANDALDITEAERESRITDLFKKIGQEVQFID